ncbi:hypothetical protein BST61_g10355 [Cercospora zeina]
MVGASRALTVDKAPKHVDTSDTGAPISAHEEAGGCLTPVRGDEGPEDVGSVGVITEAAGAANKLLT